MDLHTKHAQVLSTLHAYKGIFYGHEYILVKWKIGQANFRGSFQDTHSRKIVYIIRKRINVYIT